MQDVDLEEISGLYSDGNLSQAIARQVQCLSVSVCLSGDLWLVFRDAKHAYGNFFVHYSYHYYRGF